MSTDGRDESDTCNRGARGQPRPAATGIRDAVATLERLVRRTESTPIEPRVESGRGKALRVEAYDGVAEEWSDFEQRFEIASLCNRWNDDDKGLYLAACLTGSAKTVLTGLTGKECRDFELLSHRLKTKFATTQRQDKHRRALWDLNRKTGESVLEYADQVEYLLSRGFTELPNDTRRTLAVDAFLRGLPKGPLRFHCRLRGPESLQDAVDFALRFEEAEADGRDNGPGCHEATPSHATERAVRNELPGRKEEIPGAGEFSLPPPTGN